MVAPTLNIRTVCDGDRVMLAQFEAVISTPIMNDIPGSLTIYWPVTFVVTEGEVVEVRLMKINAELLWQSDGHFICQVKALTSQGGPYGTRSMGRIAG